MFWTIYLPSSMLSSIPCSAKGDLLSTEDFQSPLPPYVATWVATKGTYST